MRRSLKIIHLYDGHERVYPGEGSVLTVVYQLARHTARLGHDVTVLERRWEGTDYKEKIDGIRFLRFDLKICSNISNKEVVAEQVRSPIGTSRLVMDRLLFAFIARRFKLDMYDVIHVHLPFAANIIVSLDRKSVKKWSTQLISVRRQRD